MIKKVGNRQISTAADLQAAIGEAKQKGRQHTLALIHHADTERFVALPVG